MLVKFTIFMALLAGLCGCNHSNKNHPPSTIPKFPEVSQIKLVDLTAVPIDLEKYRGKTVFINVWATWCKPCLQEMPSIARAQEILTNKDIVFIIASAESEEETREERADWPYRFNYAILENMEALGIQALPTTYIINPKGKLVFSEIGSREWDEPSNINLIKNIATQHE